MSNEKRERRAHRKSAASAHSDAETRREPQRASGRAFPRGAESFLSMLPTDLSEKLKRNPYRALGIACAVGVGAGVVLGSRILRSAVASATSRAIVELGRTFLIHEAK